MALLKKKRADRLVVAGLAIAGTVRLPDRVPVAPLQQLNLKLPPAVLDHWRTQAAAEGLSIRDWLIARLGPGAPQAAPGAGADLLQRVEALEAGLAQLETRRMPPAQLVVPAQLPLTTEPSSPERIDPPALAGDAITTAELAERTGTNPGGWNNWAGAPGRVGQVRHHATAGSWRLIGKVPPPAGGPARWLWEPAAAGAVPAG